MTAPEDSAEAASKHPSASSTGSRCPVKHEDRGATSSFWGKLLSPSSSVAPPTDTTTTTEKDSFNTSNTTKLPPASLEEAARHAQTPQQDQRIALGRDRQVSSIPRAGTDAAAPLPHHQYFLRGGSSSDGENKNNSNNNWVYPSEQQLYNAMRQKGWSNVPEESIPTVLQIHNHINEHTWAQIQNWEGTGDVTLARFQGRPRDLTPKAFFLSRVLRRCDPPFDRHDWYVRHNNDGDSNNDAVVVEQRYVIDYYYRPPPQPHLPPVPYVDARPALDHPRALYLRARRFLQLALPGISAYLNDDTGNSSNSNGSSSSKAEKAQAQSDHSTEK